MDTRARDDDQLWHPLIEHGAAESYPRGSIIYTPDQPADDLFLIVSGHVSLYLRSPEGRPLTLRTIETGQLMGHVAAAMSGTFDSYAETTSAVQLYRIPAGKVTALLERDPSLGLALVEDLSRHRAVVSERIDEVAFKSVSARLASVLLELAQRHGGGDDGRFPRHSHRQLAEMVNAYRETVTKVLNQFRDARLLEIERHTIMLLNLRRLEELAQS